MNIYRCCQCQFATTDPSVPECPNCHAQLVEEEETSEDYLEKGQSYSSLKYWQ